MKLKRILSVMLALIMVTISIPMTSVANDQTTSNETLKKHKLSVAWNEIPIYDGTEHKPVSHVTYENKLMVEGEDYTLEYKNNINAGTEACVIITGIGNYESLLKEEKFTILPTDISEYNVEMSSAKFTSDYVTPDEIKVTSDTGYELEQDIDYKVYYTNNVNTGNAIATVVGIGNYTGYIRSGFNIVDGINITTEIKIVDGETYYAYEDSYVSFDIYFDVQETNGTLSVTGITSDGTEVNYGDDTYVYFDHPGTYTAKYSYNTGYYETGYKYNSNGVLVMTKEWVSTGKVTKTSTIKILESPSVPGSIIASAPVYLGYDKILLYVSGGVSLSNRDFHSMWWTSSDSNVATIDNGIVTLCKPGAVIFSTYSTYKPFDSAIWEFQKNDFSALNIAGKNTNYLGIEPPKDNSIQIDSEGLPIDFDILLTYGNQRMRKDIDYTIICENDTENNDLIKITINGINLFDGRLTEYLYKDTLYEYGICPGDADGDNGITLADVTLLLQKIAGWSVEVPGDADANADGTVDLNDATLLLQFIAGWNVTLG